LLTIRGERKFIRPTKEVELLEGEVNYGVFERTFELPRGRAGGEAERRAVLFSPTSLGSSSAISSHKTGRGSAALHVATLVYGVIVSILTFQRIL